MDLCKVPVQRFTKTELSGVQDCSAGRFEVVVDRFLAEVSEEKVRFQYRGSRAKFVRIFQQDEELRRVLSWYGTVYAIQRDTIPGFADFLSGTRSVRWTCIGLSRTCRGF